MLRNSLIFFLLMVPGFLSAERSSDGYHKSQSVDLQTFTQVFEYVKENYVSPVEEDRLLQDAMRGAMSALDPHSAYLDKDEFDDLKINVTGELGGLGVKVMSDGGFVHVVNTIDEGPAEHAGVKSGDKITHLDNIAVNELSPRDAIKKMRGKKGTPINLTLLRVGEPKPLNIVVVRDIITIHSVRSKILDNHFGYLKISEFQTNSGEDVTAAIQKLKKNNAGKLKGLILDLRNNPGGAVESAVEIADAFLDRDKLKQYEGVIVYAKGRAPRSRFKERAHPGDILNGSPLVVIVNHASASASEIVAGALQDYGRAIIIGTQTFGKGSVQTLLPLKENQALKLTTALYYTPAGRSIQATGIIPDILVQNITLPGKENKTKVLSESPLNSKQKEEDTASLLCSDYQLNEALNILKGVSLMNAENG
jgi:carboxyl-terminal processing protease